MVANRRWLRGAIDIAKQIAAPKKFTLHISNILPKRPIHQESEESPFSFIDYNLPEAAVALVAREGRSHRWFIVGCVTESFI